jgi:hypothetical protein
LVKTLVTRLGYEAWSQPWLRGLVKVQSSAPTVTTFITRLGHEAWTVIYTDCYEAWTVIYADSVDTWTFILVKG